jgi:hypothetical protein
MTARRGKRLAAVSVGALLLSSLATTGGTLASANPVTTFDATTEATGMEVTVSNPTIPAGIVIEGSGPTAASRLSSLGTSDSFAALPYPGDTAANLPGTVSALTNVPLPPYPLYVHSSNGQKAAPANYPGDSLTAETSGVRSAAHAVASSESTGYAADTVVSTDSDGSVSAVSTATQNGLDIGGQVTLSGVVAKASAILGSDGKIKTTSSIIVGRIAAPAMVYTVPDKVCIPTQSCVTLPPPFAGFKLKDPNIGYSNGNFTLTLPIVGAQTFPVPADTVFAALSTVGVTATFEKAIVTPTSVVAPTLSMKTTLPSLPNNQVFNGPTPVTYILGRASASIAGNITDDGSGFSLPPVNPGTTGNLPIDSGSSGSVLPPLAGSGLGSSGTGVPPVTVPPAVDSSGSAPGSGFQPTLSAGTRLPLHSVFWFYLVLVGVGLVGSTAGQVLRYMGVRAAWTS